MPRTKHRTSNMTNPTWHLAQRRWPSAKQIACASFAVVVAMTSSAHANEDKELRAAAAARKAEKLMAQGKVAEACTKLQESFSLDPIASSALDLARCHEKNDKLASAAQAYKQAADLAKKARDFRRRSQARRKIAQLKYRLATLTIKVGATAEGLTVQVDGKTIEPDEKGRRSMPVDAGDHVLTVTAPGRAAYESKFKIKNRQRKQLDVPKLAVEKKPKATPAKKPKLEAKETPEPAEKDASQPEEEQGQGEASSNRIVVQASFLGGLANGRVTGGDFEELGSVPYAIRTDEDGQLLAACGDTTTIPGAGECKATFANALLGMVGGELLVAYSLLPRLHVGARAWGMKTFPNGFAILGGPTLSVRAYGPAWVGASFMLGTQEYRTQVTSANGSVPDKLVTYNPQNEIDIPLSQFPTTEADVSSGLAYGGALHLSAAIFGSAPEAIWSASMPHAILNGSVHAGVDAALVKVDNGISLFVPIHLGYRFY